MLEVFKQAEATQLLTPIKWQLLSWHFKLKALNNIMWLNNANRSHERDVTDGLFEKQKNQQIHIFAFNFLKAQKQ